MKEEITKLLDKYYKGETTPEEETLLKSEVLSDMYLSPEKELFAWYAEEATLPEGIEEDIYKTVEQQAKKRSFRKIIYSVTSMAAAVVLAVTLYVDYQHDKQAEENFRIMEQALFKVSDSLQPGPEEPEMLVLWLDDNVEIIVN